MNRRFSLFLNYVLVGLLLLLATSQTAVAQLQKGSLWRDAVITKLDVDFGGTGFHARWRFHRCDCGDVWVALEQVAPDEVLSGELMLVGGNVLLARGLDAAGGDIEPLIQAPTLMLQLAYALLNRSQPNGPYAVSKKQVWNEKESKLDLKLSTGMTTGAFNAPWSVNGSGWESSNGSHRFELDFQFTVDIPGEDQTSSSITFSGELDYRQQAFPYPESTDLGGWGIQWFTLNETEAKPVPKGLTLKELRLKVKDI